MCQCYQIGGPFIAEDPDCPVHGTGGYAVQLESARTKITDLEMRVAELEMALDIAIDTLRWISSSTSSSNT